MGSDWVSRQFTGAINKQFRKGFIPDWIPPLCIDISVYLRNGHNEKLLVITTYVRYLPCINTKQKTQIISKCRLDSRLHQVQINITTPKNKMCHNVQKSNWECCPNFIRVKGIMYLWQEAKHGILAVSQ